MNTQSRTQVKLRSIKKGLEARFPHSMNFRHINGKRALLRMKKISPFARQSPLGTRFDLERCCSAHGYAGPPTPASLL
jgi:hypothetical protein